MKCSKYCRFTNGHPKPNNTEQDLTRDKGMDGNVKDYVSGGRVPVSLDVDYNPSPLPLPLLG